MLKMISSPFCAVSVLNVCEPHKGMRIDVIRLEIRTLSPRPFKFFFQQLIDFYSCEVVS